MLSPVDFNRLGISDEWPKGRFCLFLYSEGMLTAAAGELFVIGSHAILIFLAVFDNITALGAAEVFDGQIPGMFPFLRHDIIAHTVCI